MSVPIVILSLLGLSAIVALVAWTQWKAKQVDNAREWPAVEATIQSAEIERIGGGRNAPHLPCFAFSYVVDGEYYSGRFALSVKGDQADSLTKEMIDRKFSVNYDPARPSFFFIPDDIEGCEVCQKLSEKLDPLYPSS
jgi:hypothetical protein